MTKKGTSKSTTTTPPGLEGWKKVRGMKGLFSRPFMHGDIIRDPDQCFWWLELPRGAGGPKGCDWWGPWEGDDEEAIIAEMAKLDRRLARQGWFRMEYDAERGLDWAVAGPILRKIPRDMLMPSYYVAQLDHDLAERGESREGDMVRIGGADLHFDRAGSVSNLGGPMKAAQFVITPPGMSTRVAGEGIDFVMEAAGLDNLIAFLIDVRKSLVNPATVEAYTKNLMRVLETNEMAEKRHQAIAEAAEISGALLSTMVEVGFNRPDRLDLLHTVLTVFANGDRISEISVSSDDGTPAVVEVHVDEDTALAQATTERESIRYMN